MKQDVFSYLKNPIALSKIISKYNKKPNVFKTLCLKNQQRKTRDKLKDTKY